jgi:hypothetical protein
MKRTDVSSGVFGEKTVYQVEADMAYFQIQCHAPSEPILKGTARDITKSIKPSLS